MCYSKYAMLPHHDLKIRNCKVHQPKVQKNVVPKVMTGTFPLVDAAQNVTLISSIC